MRHLWEKLNRREQTAILAGSCCLLLFIGIRIGVLPILDKQEILRRQIDAKQTTIREMQGLRSEYFRLQASLSATKDLAGQRPSGFSLFPFLDRLAGETGIKDRVVFMKPSRIAEENGDIQIERVELKIQAMSLEELSRYLYGIEMSPNLVTVTRLSVLKTDKNQGAVDVLFQVESPLML